MAEGRRSPLNLNSLLAAVEAAPPVTAVDALAGALAEAIGAREVSFLIADFSGRSLIRLGHSGGVIVLALLAWYVLPRGGRRKRPPRG
jgi:hypothetical protein